MGEPPWLNDPRRAPSGGTTSPTGWWPRSRRSARPPSPPTWPAAPPAGPRPTRCSRSRRWSLAADPDARRAGSVRRAEPRRRSATGSCAGSAASGAARLARRVLVGAVGAAAAAAVVVVAVVAVGGRRRTRPARRRDVRVRARCPAGAAVDVDGGRTTTATARSCSSWPAASTPTSPTRCGSPRPAAPTPTASRRARSAPTTTARSTSASAAPCDPDDVGRVWATDARRHRPRHRGLTPTRSGVVPQRQVGTTPERGAYAGMRSGTIDGELGDGPVGGLGGAELVGAEQVGHDPQHPLHERLRLHADAGELLHEGGLADDDGEGAGHPEVEAVLLLEQVGVAGQRHGRARRRAPRR